MTTSTSTPLRKSDASRLFRTPQSVVREPANDDEAERRNRRSVATLNDSSMAAEENENIKMCLKLYSDNKMSKDNAWSLTIIDSFATLMARHSKSLQNFQVAGSTLEASTKVYGLRVDSVHTDVMRMCSELTRQTARAMNNNPADEDDPEDGQGAGDQTMAEGGDGNDKENDQTVNAQPKAKKKRARKGVSTVTKSKESINGPLDTNPFMDPFFAKLNSVVGDVNSSSRLMQNIVPTKNAELRLCMDYRFWDATESLELDLNGMPEAYDGLECSTLRCFPLGPGNLLRSLRSGYLITDAPAEDDEDDEDTSRAPLDDHMDDVEAREHGASLMNRSALDVHFDINAEVEPVPSGDAFILDYDAKDIDANDDFAEDDELALEQCKGLMRKTVVIEDMRPIDTCSSQLEYSYRPLDNISQFWAGPAHWKFKRSLRSRATVVASDGASTVSTNSKERVSRKKKRFELDTLDDALSVSENLFLEYNPNRPLKGITLLKSSVCKKWESKKLKLPTDYNLDPNRFDVYKYALGINIQDHGGVGVSGLAPSETYSCDGGDDQISCSNDTNDGGDNDMMVNHDDGDFHPMEHDNGPLNHGEKDKTLNASVVDVISSEFQGAPDRVHKINIAYAKTAKVIDMKQLKYNCWRIISSHVQADLGPRPSQNPSQLDVSLPPPTQADEAKVTFTTLYRKVPQLLSKTMSENISKSLAFYAVLHLANEKSLLLGRQEDLKDFTIRKADE
ncbi:condensin complex subunit 2 isoform X1 [Anopheles maculipalpis]|uniref:condensin complex subunit 2 isoform X1 n=3 Tax=Anopheles maculipalpis TaxID=1496333 RepID=UPI00215907CE|nr:condensin complex subunit 2 isoform X1 [Anopheles maculipalpis]